jgi:hypothetical protein
VIQTDLSKGLTTAGFPLHFPLVNGEGSILQNVEGFLASENGWYPKHQSCLLNLLNNITIITTVHHRHNLDSLSSVSHSYDRLAI